MQIKGKVALITGAGSGIGKAAALMFVKEGAKVVALGHTADELDETVMEAETFGEVIGITADISNADEMRQVTLPAPRCGLTARNRCCKAKIIF